MNHTPECIQQNTEHMVHYAAWMAKYPKYCKRCYGTGVGSYDPGDRDTPSSSEPCEDCLGNWTHKRDENGALVYEDMYRAVGFDLAPGTSEIKKILVMMEDARCPRCLGPMIDPTGEGACAVCGWNENAPDAYPPPETNDCWGDCIPEYTGAQ